MLSNLEFGDYDDAGFVPKGHGMSALHKSLKSKRQMTAPKTARVSWALRGKAKFVEQLDSFPALVSRLYDLVPLAGTDQSPSPGAAIDPNGQSKMSDGYGPLFRSVNGGQ